MPDYRITVRQGTAGWTIVALMLIIGVIAAVGFGSSGPASGGARTAVSLRVVPTMRFATVSPSKTTFTECHGGKAPFHSTQTALGYPNANCWIGRRKATWPIKINSGPRAEVLVWGYDAVPSDGGTQWRLCDAGATDPAVACKRGRLPGKDQFVVGYFSRTVPNPTRLTDAQLCAATLTSSSRCVVSMGQSQKEGLEVIGPVSPHDNSTLWNIRIAWIAVPP